MKLRSKRGSAHFIVIDRATGEKQHIRNSNHLSRRQTRKMSVRPDMILQYAHYLADAYADGGVRPIVRVDAVASVNQRELQTLIDPDVDLTTKSSGLRHKDWVVPLTATHEPGSGDQDEERRVRSN